MNASGQHYHLSQALLLQAELPKRTGRGRKAEEGRGSRLVLHEGSEAAERLQSVHYPDGYEDDGYVLSSADALTAPKPAGERLRLIKPIACSI